MGKCRRIFQKETEEKMKNNINVQTSVEISIWKSFRASVWDSLFNSTAYAVRFNALRNLTIAALTDRSSRAIVGSVFAASENATRDYFETE